LTEQSSEAEVVMKQETKWSTVVVRKPPRSTKNKTTINDSAQPQEEGPAHTGETFRDELNSKQNNSI